MYNPRPYQQDAIDSILDWCKKSVEPCLIEAATGAGKSIIVAKTAITLTELSGKKVLCLAPSSELTEQNHEKYTSYGYEASFYSASIGKSMRHNVIFGTPMSVKNNVRRFQDFAAVIIDECHQITPTIKSIIEEMRKSNPQLRVIGLSATPYRLNDGYIYAYDENNNPVPSDQTKNPYFHTMVYRITADYLISLGFLTRPHADPDHAQSYDTTDIKRHTEKEYDRVFTGQGRLTAEIVNDVVSHSNGRMGVMIFAATVRHAKEVIESLDPDNSRLITGATPKAERRDIIQEYKAHKFKYLVNVSVLTTGFDAPHVDVIAILRATESASLLQQIIGRGMRIHDNKKDCLVLDYAGNIERHQLEDDLFTPMIQARTSKKGEPMDVTCPSCASTNEFSMRKNDGDYDIDSEGYFTDLAGNRIEYEEGKFLPAHFGRRCFGYSLINGRAERCEHRWSVKQCEECQHENDITARVCEKCKAEMINPNDKLKLDFHKVKADPYQVSTDKVIGFTLDQWMGSKTNTLMLKAHYVTEFRKFDVWYNPESRSAQIQGVFQDFSKAYFNGKVCPNVEMFIKHKDKGTQPKTVTYARKKGTKYFEVYGHNRPEDEAPK